MKLKAWGVLPITKSQLIIFETLNFAFFFLLTIFFFSYDFPKYVNDPLVLFHAKYMKYVCLILAFLTVVEAQYYLNKFITLQLNINKKQKIKIEKQHIDLQHKQQQLLESQEEIRTQRDDAIEKHRVIKLQKEKITDSIIYASRIQKALLSPQNLIPEMLKYFILFKPKDIVSGDYYWISKKGNRTVFVAADCTGHGVPGAFMSVLGIAFLNEIVNKAELDISAGEILNRLRDKVVQVFNQDTEAISKRRDGMDVALYIIDYEKNELQYAGANNPLFLIRKIDDDKQSDVTYDSKVRVSDDGVCKLIHYKPDRMPVGLHPVNDSFNNHNIKFQKDDTFYIFSDGYADQFGGETGKKFLTGKLKKLLLDIQGKSMKEQKEALTESFENWIDYTGISGEKYKQLDDVLILGVKI